jgi:hypothetical protein
MRYSELFPAFRELKAERNGKDSSRGMNIKDFKNAEI